MRTSNIFVPAAPVAGDSRLHLSVTLCWRQLAAATSATRDNNRSIINMICHHCSSTAHPNHSYTLGSEKKTPTYVFFNNSKENFLGC